MTITNFKQRDKDILSCILGEPNLDKQKLCIQEYFPLLAVLSSGPKLIDIILNNTPFNDETFSQELDRAEKKDKETERTYKSGALGRLAMVEWNESYNITPDVKQEIQRLQTLLKGTL